MSITINWIKNELDIVGFEIFDNSNNIIFKYELTVNEHYNSTLKVPNYIAKGFLDVSNVVNGGYIELRGLIIFPNEGMVGRTPQNNERQEVIEFLKNLNVLEVYRRLVNL